MSGAEEFLRRGAGRVHCLGVGGMGVGPLAIYLAQCGWAVSGEDDALGADMRAQLRRAGVAIGPRPEPCDLVVHSSAIAPTHPALAAATARGLRIVRRGEMLAEMARGKKLVAVCGSHGKTTTTAMLITALRRANFPASYVLGGLLADGTPPAAAVDGADWLVAEVDESDGTMAEFAPEITVAVNLDWDHPDHYRTREEIEAAFAGLWARTRGVVLVNAECEMSGRVRDRWERACSRLGGDRREQARSHSFGSTGDFPGAIVANDAEGMRLRLGGKFSVGETSVRARGDFNAINATAALAAAQLMGATLGENLLAEYPGVRRRQGVLHDAEGLLVIEDYAHHPAEIRALLGSLRARAAEGGRLMVVFQPHRFSRTAQFKAEFAEALRGADGVFLLEVYPAGEAPVAGGTANDIKLVLQSAAPGLPVAGPASEAEVLGALSREAGAGGVIAFVGAGDIDRKARAWLAGRRWDEVQQALAAAVSSETRVRREEPLAPKTTMRVGGAARVYAEPASVADLQALLRGAQARGVEVFLLGRGSNLLVPDEGVDGLVISLGHPAWATFEPRGDGRVWVGAGLRLKNLCGLAAKAGLVGFEFLEGIPGNVGGALRMNAGAMGGWMFDVVEAVQVMSMAGETTTLPKSAMHVDYRQCAELQHAIALGALLRPAAQAGADTVKRQMDAYAKKRHESQPREPSAGCIFKNPPGNSAGKLIDECGLKGERVGDAEVSPVHANFIVNRGGATATDVLELVRRVRARVRERKGVDLQPEVLLYGRRWEDVLGESRAES